MTDTWELRLALSVQQMVREQERLRAAAREYREVGHSAMAADFAAQAHGIDLALAAVGGTLGIMGENGRMRLIEWADERTARVV